MSELPSMPLFVDDYEAATTHLTPEEDGTYTRLLRLCWRTPGCMVPNDPVWLTKRLRVTPEFFERVVKPILAEFFTVEGGRLFQKRLRKEYEYVTEVVAKRKEAGSKGGKAKALKTLASDAGKATDLPLANGKQTPSKTLAPTLTPTPKELAPNGALSETVVSDVKRAARKPYPDDFEAAWAAYPTHRNMSKAEALTAWNKLSKDDRAQVLPSIPGYVAYLKTKPDLETIHFCRYLSKRRFEGYAATESGAGSPADPELVTLPPEHPDFKMMERVTGRSFPVGNRGVWSFKRTEIEAARRHASEPDLLASAHP